MRETFYSFLEGTETEGNVVENIFDGEAFLRRTKKEVEDYVSWYREKGLKIRIVKVIMEVEVEE